MEVLKRMEPNDYIDCIGNDAASVWMPSDLPELEAWTLEEVLHGRH